MKTYILKRPSEAVRQIFDLWADDLVRGALVTHEDCSDVIAMFRAIASVPTEKIIFSEDNFVWLWNHFSEQMQLYGVAEPGLRNEVLPVLAWLDTAEVVG